jgi:hypothetical protein
MSNPVFYAADHSGTTFTMSLSENTSFPLSNLHTNLAAMLWKSSANTNSQTLKIDLGSAKACDFIGIGAYNWDTMTTVSFQYATTDDGNFSDPQTVTSAFFGVSAPFIHAFNSVTKRYWRIIFTNTNSLIPQCGLLYLGLKMAMPYNYNMDVDKNNKQFTTDSKSSLDGTLRTTKQIDGRKRIEASFTLVDDTTATAWQTLLDKIQGKLNPFFFVDDASVIHIMHFEEDYIPVQCVRANVNDIVRLKMCHQTTG